MSPELLYEFKCAGGNLAVLAFAYEKQRAEFTTSFRELQAENKKLKKANSRLSVENENLKTQQTFNLNAI